MRKELRKAGQLLFAVKLEAKLRSKGLGRGLYDTLDVLEAAVMVDMEISTVGVAWSGAAAASRRRNSCSS